MSVEIKKDSFLIENNIVGKLLEIKGSKLVSSKIINKQNGENIEFESGSNEFIICFKGLLGGELVKSSELKIRDYSFLDLPDKDTLSIEFKQFKIKGCKISLTLVLELGKLDFYINKYLKFQCEEEKGEKAVLDYIDFESFTISDLSTSWCLPEQQKSHISGFALSLGQPVFYKSAFFGCEFPASLGTIENNTAKVRRYYGKALSSLLCENGSFKSDKAVCGVAPACVYGSVRSAFFDYIDKISKRTNFRVQYNSWYDNFLDISKENIKKSFLEIEKGLNSVGMESLDCYVVDDGWNDYNSDFWRFNSKFPDELYSSSALARNLGSSFGLWLGPRGGYTKDTIKFARRIEKAGNGFFNKKGFDICVASDKYINKTSLLMLDWQERFKLGYWKLDGFSRRACNNKNHDHAVGGKNDIYYHTELWEKWLRVFEELTKDKLNPPFINLTCYAMPSPWLLKWVNTVWLQCSDDMGKVKKFDDGRRDCGSNKDKLLTYRDSRYYEFYSERQFCFPASRIYNHDPIYANKAGIEMSDEEFRDYMFVNAARGTQFFELYFSPEMMSESKWRIANEALLFARENSDLLSKAVMFGGKPTAAQVYGYSAFDSSRGIVMLRNPDNKEKDFTFALDENIGVGKGLFEAEVSYVLPCSKKPSEEKYSYKDTFKAVLKPYETVIIQFARRTKSVECTYVKSRSDKTLEVMFNQTVSIENLNCEQNPIIKTTLLSDRRSALIEFKYSFIEDNKLVLSNVSDACDKPFDVNVDFKYYENNIINKGSIEGDGDFTIEVHLNGEYIQNLFTQGNDLSLYLRDGKVYFKIGDTVLSSASNVDSVKKITAVRERNGVMKLYLDSKLDSGIRPVGKAHSIEGKAPICFDVNRIKLYNKALSYDEV